MFLKRIELHGFKSFADQSVIEFQPGITGVVGPNGCGKSNIADAVRWVLGEQSVKSLRGSTMSDVIFNGSEDRKPQNLAEVTLVFDNEDHYFNVDYNEVQITRRLYRADNEAEYLINKEPVRLKDILDLMMDTGLGRDSLSIISQGNISTFADSKPENRRGMFEEAAGVAKYKKRKDESIRKLERTMNNLERVEDICTELEKQVGPLKRQKEKAETYLELKDELESIEVNVLVKSIKSLSDELASIRNEIKSLEASKVAKEGEILISEQNNDDLKQRMFDLDNEVNNLQSDLLVAMNNVNELETRQVEITMHRQHLMESNDQASLQTRIELLKETLNDAIIEYNDNVKRYTEVKEELSNLKQQSSDSSNNLDVIHRTIESTTIELNGLRNEHTRLVDEINNNSRYSYGVKSILDSKNSLNGIVGVLGELVQVDEAYEDAYNVAIGAANNFIITKTNEDARNAISFLKKNNSGRATFLPIDTMSPRSLRDEHKVICENFDGYLGVMSDFVSSKEEIDSIILNQLGNVIVTETLQDATELSKLTYARYKVVTLDGEEVHVGGSLTGGSKNKKSNPFNAKHRLTDLENDIKIKESQLIDLKSKLNDLENDSREISHQLLQKQMGFAKIELTLTNKKSELNTIKSEYEELTNQSVELDEISNGIKNNEVLVALNDAKATRDRLTETIQSKRELRMSYVNDSEQIETSLKALRKDLREINDQISNHQVNEAKNDTELNNQLNRLNETYKMTFDYAAENYYKEIDYDKAVIRVKDLRREIESLGNVNLDAIEEYKEVSTRFETLNNQRLDLIDARETILKAISEMDEIMIERFDDTFHKINHEFNHVFRSLFGGGKAELKYTDPDNILETGIDIDVVPPGKAKQNISLFSGGEKALIAISCLFAILRVRPVPMCILDECEAALDVANVERYAKYLRQFSQTTQFIVVTHREGTMAECDLLYGATMQQKGVTKLVSVKLKDAIDMAENA